MTKPPSRIDWAKAAAHPSLKRQGREFHGPCPLTGGGKDRFWVHPDATTIGCRGCSNSGGDLNGDQVREHIQALGAWREPPPRAKGRERWTEIERWTWRTADGVTRDQIRYRKPDGTDAKLWEDTKKQKPPRKHNDPPPSRLLYIPGQRLDNESIRTLPWLVCEGASDADAAVARGIPAIARSNAKPTKESLRRLDVEGREYWLTPDADEAGERQAHEWEWAMRAAGLSVRVVDMPSLKPAGAPRGWDVRDWLRTLPRDRDPVAILRDHLRPEAEAAPEAAVERIEIEPGPRGAVEAIRRLNIWLRYNELSGLDEWRRDEGPWIPRVDGWESTIRIEIQGGFVYADRNKPTPARMTKDVFGSAVESLAWLNKENPVLTWLHQLPPWDGEPRLDNWMRVCWDCSGMPDELLTWASCKPFIACVRRQVEPGYKHDVVAVISGDQGIGKSSVLRALCPRPEWFTDGLSLGGSDQERIESLLGHVWVEVSDLQGIERLRNAGVEDLKAFISRQVDKIRLAYRRNPDHFPRRCVLWATKNREARLLSDESGTRRFVVVEVEQGDPVAEIVEWCEENCQQIWAEAWARRDEPSYLPPHLQTLNERHTGAHQPYDEAAEALVDKLLARVSDGSDGFNLNTEVERLLKAGEDGPRRDWLHPKERPKLCAALRQRGWRTKSPRDPATGRPKRVWIREAPEPVPAGAPAPEPEDGYPEPDGEIREPKQPGAEGDLLAGGPETAGNTMRCVGCGGRIMSNDACQTWCFDCEAEKRSKGDGD